MAISRYNMRYQCFSLDEDQSEVIDHVTGNKINEKRNILKESARIARGNCKDIKELKVNDFSVSISINNRR
jgi:enhancing lycopene biosynthesis protein 2